MACDKWPTYNDTQFWKSLVKLFQSRQECFLQTCSLRGQCLQNFTVQVQDYRTSKDQSLIASCNGLLGNDHKRKHSLPMSLLSMAANVG